LTFNCIVWRDGVCVFPDFAADMFFLQTCHNKKIAKSLSADSILQVFFISAKSSLRFVGAVPRKKSFVYYMHHLGRIIDIYGRMLLPLIYRPRH
jgi:hypothetical protein